MPCFLCSSQKAIQAVLKDASSRQEHLSRCGDQARTSKAVLFNPVTSDGLSHMSSAPHHLVRAGAWHWNYTMTLIKL